MEFTVSLSRLEEMAECIHDCNWVSSDEIYDYMRSIVTGAGDYEPEDWSVDGLGLVTKNRVIELDKNT